MLHDLFWYVYILYTYILVLQLGIFITIIEVRDICILINKVARPAHGVENLPRANQKTQNFQYNYHSFSLVNSFVS
jgi:hypothetical protein